MRTFSLGLIAAAILAIPATAFPQGAGVEVKTPIPAGVDMFSLNLG